MKNTTIYRSPMGEILIACDKKGLTGLWFEKERFNDKNRDLECEEAEMPALKETRRWLDIYFTGKEPDFMPPIHMSGSPFRLSVWKILRQIPYGKTVTYGEIARMIAQERGIGKMSAQAVGGAVGHNEISIIIPCHRVIGTGGNLTGYAGGIERKAKLLSLEGVDMKHLFIPGREMNRQRNKSK